jgi:hypothetical protein
VFHVWVLRDGLDGTGGDTWVETDVMSRMSGVRSCGRTRVRTATVLRLEAASDAVGRRAWGCA